MATIAAVVTERAIEGPPTLVIEILSVTTRRTDRQTKAQLYAKHGVSHYWLIDPDQQSIEAYELSVDQYNLAVKAQKRGAVQPDPLPRSLRYARRSLVINASSGIYLITLCARATRWVES